MSYKDAMKVYSLPQPGEVVKKKAKKKVLKQLVIDHVNANNSDLDILFEVQRREHEAARVIQRIWKKSQRLIPWRKAVFALKCIVKIQKMARGMITRRYVAMWYKVRRAVIIELQSRVRRHLSNKYVRPVLQKEQQAILRLQPFIRGYLGRKRYRRILSNLCATRIQALWRGVVARSECDKRWLSTTVIPIQNTARRMIAMTRFKARFRILHQAANIIQRRFRLYLAKTRVGDALFQREMSYRMEMIAMLTAEEELCQERINRVMDRVVKQQVKEKAEQAMQVVSKSELDIFQLETALIEISRQLEILSPRGYEQGFFEELSKNKATIRKELTQAKIKHLFDFTKDLQIKDEIFETQVKELEECATQSKRISKWRQDEYDERRHMTYERDINQKRREESFAIGEEKRKWQVLYYTKDGKPDKRRRPGRPWDPSIFAGAEKAVYTSGAGVDLLAFLRNPIPTMPAPQPAPGTTGAAGAGGGGIVSGVSTQVQEDVNKAMSQVALQAYMDQMKVYEDLMAPISRIMQQYTGLIPNSKTGELHGLEDQGWGEEGRKVTEALIDIGAMDGIKPTKRERIIGGFSKSNILFANSHNNIHNEHTQIIQRRGVDHQNTPNLSRSASKLNLSRSASFKQPVDDFEVVGGNLQNQSRLGTAGGKAFSGHQIDEEDENVEEVESVHSHILKSHNFHGKKAPKQGSRAANEDMLDPGSVFPLGPNASEFSLRKFLRGQPSAGNNAHNSSMRSMSRNALINTATTEEKPDQPALIETLSGRITSRGGGRSWSENNTRLKASRNSSQSLSSLLAGVPSVEVLHDDMSEVTEGDERSVGMQALQRVPSAANNVPPSDNDEVVVSADSVYQSLRKCWKKPPKAYLPKPEAFIPTYFNDLDRHRSALGNKSMSLLDESSAGKYSMSSGFASQSLPHPVAQELGGKSNQLAPLRQSVTQPSSSPQREAPKKTKSFKDFDGEEDDDEDGSIPFHRPDYYTDKQRRIEENTVIRQALHERNRQRKKKNVRSSVIPWNLLDELDGAKSRFDNEKSFLEFNHKF